MLHTRRFCVALGFIWCSLWMGTDALAQGNEAVDHAQRANSLSGIVVDMAGAPVTGVAVAECSAGFKDCVSEARSGKDGHFTIQSNRKGTVHYLRFDLPGLDEERETITLSRFSKKLTIRLVVGT